MSVRLSDNRPLRVVIREIKIAAASPIEGRRLADALPAALERAFVRARTNAPPALAPRQGRIDRVATEIVRAVARQAEGRA
jgi:hypothetical protein